MFFDVFRELCEKKGVTPSRAALDCGLSKSAVSQWKTRGSSPKFEQLSKIAAYFGVSVDYLLGNTEEKEKPAAAQDARQQELVVLARRAGKIPDEDYKRIVKTFEDTIDIYLKARGLNPDDYR